MPENVIINALKKIIKSQRRVNAIAQSLSIYMEEVAARGDVAEAYKLKKELLRLMRILEQLAVSFEELDQVRVSRMERAAAHKDRQQVIN